MLGKAEALTAEPYQLYPGRRTAEFTDLQNSAFKQAGDLGVMGQTTQATDLASKAGLGALGLQYGASNYANQFQAPGDYMAGRFRADNVGTQSFTQPGTAANYMSPYMQNVVDIQQREARRASDIQAQQNAAQAVGQGAFGGSRAGLMEAERQRNLGTQLGDIQATGQQAAFNAAQQQFNQEQQARLAAQQSNQQARLQAQQLGEQSRQFGAGQGLQAANLGAQYGLSAQQMNEQSRQFGANLGLQGLQTGLAAAGQLGTLGQNQYAQQTGNINLLNQLGTQQQQQQQNILNQQYQDFLTQKQDPYNKLAFQQSMLSGLPLTDTVKNVYSNPSMLSQVAGLGTAAAGMYGMYNKAQGAKKGGVIKAKKRPAGLAELALSKMSKG